MSTTFDINETKQRWQVGVKQKHRGLADILERIDKRIQIIKNYIYDLRHPLEKWQFRQGYYRGFGEYDFIDKNWSSICVGDQWGDEGYSAIFRRQVKVPPEFTGKKTALRIFVGGDSLLSINGKPYHGVDPFHHEVVLADCSKGGEVFDLELESYIAYHDESEYPLTFAVAELVSIDTDVNNAYYDVLAARKILDIKDIDPELSDYVCNYIWEPLKKIPLQERNRKELRNSILNASAQIRDSLYKNHHFQVEGLMHLVGHSHLDVVFMWPYREFIRKIARTHTTVLRLMEQYPEFRFSQSQAKIFADMKKYYPEIFLEVKKRVAEGRWEMIGAFWVEPDCNLISGESFVRQILFGQKFWQEEFGVRSRSCWQPDVFGLSWCMPQILAKSGIKYFLTNKMVVWNDTNNWTKNTFWWEGMDGSQVLAIVPPGHFVGTVEPDMVDLQWRNFSDKQTIGETIHIYGWGDGGSGPDEEMIELTQRYRNFPGLVKTAISSAEEAFDSINNKAKDTKLPVIRDELYLEAHRGTFTNKARLKKLNRQMEFLYREAEIFASFACLEGKPYPTDELQNGWEKLLTNQFHDSLPGTHVNSAYHDLLEEYEKIRSIGEKVRDNSLMTLMNNHTNGVKNQNKTNLVVFNSLLHSRNDFLTVPVNMLNECVIADSETGVLQQQKIIDLDGTEKALVRIPEIPPVGYRVFNLIKEDSSINISTNVKVTSNSLENDLIKATFNNNGELASFFDKENCREVLVEGQLGNRFQMYEDTPGRYEAWDLAPSYIEHEIDIPSDGTLVIDEKGPVRSSLLLEKNVGDSKIYQRISLCAGIRHLLFETKIDWVERQRFLKVAFPFEIQTRHATYDIAFGNITRANHSNTSYDAAKFEVPAHLWADLSQTDYGVSLLNNCKYGYDADGKILRLSLLKGATYPDPESDKETHYFVYALYPHKDGWREANTINEALNLNNPLFSRSIKECNLEKKYSFIQCNSSTITLEAIKKAEDGEDLIIRLVERYTTHRKIQLFFDRPVKKAWACNLMEEKEEELSVNSHIIDLVTKPHEIVTIRVLLK